MPRAKNPRRHAGRPPKDASRLLERVLRQNALDQRTATARFLRELRDDIASDAGGWEATTARERLLIERCAATALICSAIENHCFKQASPIGADGELLPSLRKGYATHAASLSRMLQALGLRPDRADKLPDLQTYLEAAAQKPAPGAQRSRTSGAAEPGDADQTENDDDAAQAALSNDSV